jgi:hypothetical protein
VNLHIAFDECEQWRKLQHELTSEVAQRQREYVKATTRTDAGNGAGADEKQLHDSRIFSKGVMN